jgi:hypothetical protein
MRRGRGEGKRERTEDVRRRGKNFVADVSQAGWVVWVSEH